MRSQLHPQWLDVPNAWPVISVALVGHKLERVNMAGPQEPEVALVQCGQLRFVEPFYDSKDCRVDETHVGIGVAITDFADAAVILGM